VVERCELLAAYTDQQGALTRTFLSSAMMQARHCIAAWMSEAGLTVRFDDFGNVIGRREGLSPATLLLGSHLDTVVNAGRYDGQLGILCGIELATIVADTPYSLEVIAFSEEEGVRFGMPFIGSRGFVGTLTPDMLQRRGEDGVSVERALLLTGMNPQARRASMSPVPYLGYLEIHLEQGPALEAMEQPIGIVSGIAAQKRLQVTVWGCAGHAGTTPMALRRDALAAAARMIGAIREFARPHPPLVATVGRLEVKPNVPNVIPSEVVFTIDVRHPDDEALSEAVEALASVLTDVASKESVNMDIQTISHQGAVACDPGLVTILRDAAPKAPVLASGAGHDALALAECMPTAMIFTRCRAGLSHHPDEHVEESDIAGALDAAANFMHRLVDAPFHGATN
jgi:allantoate deiminase